uniref:Uncharacterized protein n=1 Tax=Cucumis sativus TaxID=3659 RepID=A0A0A0L8T8_CUCSA
MGAVAMPLAPRKSLSSFPLCFPFTQFLPFLTSSSSSSSFFFFFLLLLSSSSLSSSRTHIESFTFNSNPHSMLSLFHKPPFACISLCSFIFQ